MLPETVAREIIASHQSRPRNRGELPGVPFATFENPSCGDRVTVWAQLDGETIQELHFDGKGCAISQSSASLMTVALEGKTLAQARALAGSFRGMVMGEAPPVPELGDLRALSGVSRLLARRKCALLAWRALEDVLPTDEAASGPAVPPAS